MTLFKNNNRRKRGVSIIGALAGFSLLGISVVGLASYMAQFEQVKRVYSQEGDYLYLHTELIESMSSMLLQAGVKIKAGAVSAKTDKGLRTEGICKVVEGSREEDKYSQERLLRSMLIKKSKLNSLNNGLDPLRWQYFIEKIEDRWEPQAITECQGPKNGFFDQIPAVHTTHKKCYKYKDLHQDIYARLVIEPQALPTFSALPASSPVDKVAFNLTSLLSIKDPSDADGTDETWSLSRQRDLILATDVHECSSEWKHLDEPVSTKKIPYRVRLSTNGLGTASLEKDLVYHSSSASPDNACSVTAGSVFLSRPVRQQGLADLTDLEDPSDELISTSSTQTALSFIRSSFACKSNPDFYNLDFYKKEHWSDTLQVTLNINVDSYSSTSLTSLILRVGPIAGVAGVALPFDLTTANQENYIIGTNGDIAPGADGDDDIVLNPGSNEFTAHIYYKEVGGPPISDLIEDVCESGSQFLKAEIKVSSCGASSIRKTFPDPIGCTVCLKKSCHAYGVSSFGPKAALQEEPLDGIIPECAIKKNHHALPNYSPPSNPTNYRDLKIADIDSERNLPPGDCTYIRNHELHVASCGYNYIERTACFMTGKNVLVPNVDPETSLKYRYSASDAPSESEPYNTCYRASITRVKRGGLTSGLIGLFTQAYLAGPGNVESAIDGQNLKQVGGDFEFYNSANQGMFLAEEDPRGIPKSIPAWYPIRREGSNMLIHAFPSIPSMLLGKAQDEEKSRLHWAFFYRKPYEELDDPRPARAPRPILLNLSHEFGIRLSRSTPLVKDPADSTDLGMILYNRIHYKGLKLEKRSIRHRYLCVRTNVDTRNSYSEHVTVVGGGVFSGGYSACHSENPVGEWAFIPPTSPEMWAAALLAAGKNRGENNYEKYPFPDPLEPRQANNHYLLNYRHFAISYPDTIERGRSEGPVWVGLEPQYDNDPPSIFLTSFPKPEDPSTWRVNLSELVKADKASLPPSPPGEPPTPRLLPDESLFQPARSLNHNPITADSSGERTRSTHIGAITHEGVPITFGDLQSEDFSDPILSILTDPNTDKITRVCYKDGVGTTYDTYRRLKLQPIDDKCSGKKSVEFKEYFEASSKGVRSMIDIYKEIYKPKKIAVFDPKRFCHAYKWERKRRAAARCMIREKSNPSPSILSERRTYLRSLCEEAWNIANRGESPIIRRPVIPSCKDSIPPGDKAGFINTCSGSSTPFRLDTDVKKDLLPFWPSIHSLGFYCVETLSPPGGGYYSIAIPALSWNYSGEVLGIPIPQGARTLPSKDEKSTVGGVSLYYNEDEMEDCFQTNITFNRTDETCGGKFAYLPLSPSIKKLCDSTGVSLSAFAPSSCG